jgi:beta-galactosidase
VLGDRFVAEFDAEGFLASYIYNGTQLLSKPMKPEFYRAMTENDYGLRPTRTRSKKAGPHYAGWLVWRTEKPLLAKFDTKELKDKCVEVKAVYNYEKSGATVTVTYLIAPDGTIAVSEKMNKPAVSPIPSMLRYGMALAMPETFDTVEFYGAGPYETYSDRKSGALVGIYKQSVGEQFWPFYARPQECGAHCNLRWWRITDTAGRGFGVVSDVLFQANALPYPMEQYDIHSDNYRKYSTRLEKDGNTYVNIDKLQQGVGCINSWGRLPLDNYLIPYENREFNFVLHPLK